jgi:translation initiation factor IF-2
MNFHREIARAGLLLILTLVSQSVRAEDKKNTAPAPVVRSAPAPVVRSAPAPVVRAAPAPVVRAAPAPVVRAPATTAAVKPAATPNAAAAARAREDAAIAAARAKTIENTRQQDRAAEAARAKQIAINRAADPKTGNKPPATSTGTAAGYNTSTTNQTVIGSNRNTGAGTSADKAAMDKIRADTKALKDKNGKPPGT